MIILLENQEVVNPDPIRLEVGTAYRHDVDETNRVKDCAWLSAWVVSSTAYRWAVPTSKRTVINECRFLWFNSRLSAWNHG